MINNPTVIEQIELHKILMTKLMDDIRKVSPRIYKLLPQTQTTTIINSLIGFPIYHETLRNSSHRRDFLQYLKNHEEEVFVKLAVYSM